VITHRHLMRFHIEALFAHAEGHLVQVNESAGASAPGFFLGRTAHGAMCRFQHDVDREVRKEPEAAIRDQSIGDTANIIEPMLDRRGHKRMTITDSDAHPPSGNDPVIDWLLDADPSIRWQVMRDLGDTPAEVVAAERSRIASEGWGSKLLDLQRPDGHWGDGTATPLWWSNLYTLLFLRDLGLDPTNTRARTAIDLVRSNVTWGPEFGDSPFFEGEVEPCINGRVLALGAYFGERSDRLVDRLLSEQLADGGWNCEAERGSVRSSFHTTICVLEGLLAFEQAFGATSPVTDARWRAQEYLLERHLLRRLSTVDVVAPGWTQLAFPTLWHYDVLRALDYLRASGVPPDARVEEAVATVLERRQGDGRWPLDVRHRNTLHQEFAGTVGAANRWITLHALRVLSWYARRV